MVEDNQLTALAVALILGGVALLAALVTYLAERRGNSRLLLWLIAVWLLACVVAFALNPTTWPFDKA